MPNVKNKWFVFYSVLLSLAIMCSEAQSASIQFGSRNKRVNLAPRFQEPMQCIVQKLQGRGYTPRDIGCFGFRRKNASAHPNGHACDVDQTARDVTRLGGRRRSRGPVAWQDQINIASGCNAVSGCKWRNPDCGHFEARSAPYSRAGTPVGGRSYKYGKKYSSRPVKYRKYKNSRSKNYYKRGYSRYIF